MDPRPVNPIDAETDIRLRWEPARLQLAASFFAWSGYHPKHSERPPNAQAARALIVSWIEANPFPRGEHYLSSMECALRIPVFFYALKRLENLAPEDRDQILQAIYMHAMLISRRLSLYSSLGNHTVTEAVGLVFAGAIFRSTRKGSAGWKPGCGFSPMNCPIRFSMMGGLQSSRWATTGLCWIYIGWRWISFKKTILLMFVNGNRGCRRRVFPECVSGQAGGPSVNRGQRRRLCRCTGNIAFAG